MKRKGKLTGVRAKRAKKSGSYRPTRGVFKGHRFRSKRAYENALARRKGFTSRYAEQRSKRPVFTRTDAKRLSTAELDARDRALDALARMRRDRMSIEHAAHLADTTVNTVIRHVGTALTKDPHGRWTATPRDNLYRGPMFMYTRYGRVSVEITDSRTASRLARYQKALEEFAETSSTARLKEFEGQSFRAGKVRYDFLTDPEELWPIVHAGELSTEGPYDTAR